MRRDKVKPTPVDYHLRANTAATLSLAQILEQPVLSCSDWKPGKNRDAVLVALIGKIERERIIHAGELGELCDLVNSLRALDAAVDFLQTDKVRTLFVND